MAESNSGEWVTVAERTAVNEGEMKGVTVGS